MSHQVTDSFELADTLSTLHTALAFFKVEHDPQLQVVQTQDHFAVAHLNLNLMVTIQIEFHEDLFDECLIGDAVSELDHFSVIFLAI